MRDREPKTLGERMIDDLIFTERVRFVMTVISFIALVVAVVAVVVIAVKV